MQINTEAFKISYATDMIKKSIFIQQDIVDVYSYKKKLM